MSQLCLQVEPSPYTRRCCAPTWLVFCCLVWPCCSPAIRSKFGVVGSWMLRLQFEGAHCATVVSRLLTLPLRTNLPDFYLLGFPVSCDTYSMYVC